MESTIKWQTGEPEVDGCYIITDKQHHVTTDTWIGRTWTRHYDKDVIAWFPLIDIEPFKF
jgi:hypothetical protein